MGAKSVLRDVARVMDMSYADGDRISKLIETGPQGDSFSPATRVTRS